MNQRTKRQALKILDGIEEITRQQMLRFGEYVSEKVVDENRREEGALCGGRQACLLGSAWIAAGVKLEKGFRGDVYLPGVTESERTGFLRSRHGLRAAYDALNKAAERRLVHFPAAVEKVHAEYDSAAEGLFESGASPWYSDFFERPGDATTRRRVLSLVASARKIIDAK